VEAVGAVGLTGAARRALHAAAAANLAAWHTSCTRALGLRPTTGERWWTCAMPAPNIYYSAISVAAAPTRRTRAEMVEALGPHSRDRTTSLLSVSDTWDQLDLRTFGLHRRSVGSWFARPPASGGPPSADIAARAGVTRPGAVPLRVEEVTDADGLATFERAMVAGFEARPPVARFDIHGPAILDDPAMHVLTGSVGDEVVACSMTYVTEVAGIYGVATLPAHRGRGYASTMTEAAAAVAPDRTAVLQPTARAEGLYRRLGFEAFGSFSHWA
jgi:GNAT superfamily N-acetyltransferase